MARQSNKRRAHGEGMIRERSDGLWEFRLRLGRGKPPLTIYAKSRAELMRRVEAEKARNGGNLRGRRRILVETYLKYWLANDVQPHRSPCTYAQYRTQVNRVLPYIGDMWLDRVDVIAIEAMYRKLRANVGACTMNRLHTVLSRAWNVAVRKDLVRANPFVQIEKPRYRAGEMRFLTPEEIQHLFAAAYGTRYYALVVLAAATGARFGELTALKWSDVDWDRNTIVIQRTKVEAVGRIEFREPKTPKSRRAILLDVATMQVLREHRDRQSREKHHSEYVFVVPDGGLLRKANFRQRYWQPLLKTAGLSDDKNPVRLRFHDLRHTHASLFLRHGVHPKIVAERLGHSSVQITLDRYSHVAAGLQEQAVLLLPAILFPEAETTKDM
jgi:integrase